MAYSFVVNTNLDIVDENDSFLSLREAVAKANFYGPFNTTTITFTAGLSGQTIALTGELALTQTQGTTINGDINGDHKADVTISGNNNGRIFKITGDDSSNAVNLQSLTLTGGGPPSGGILHDGGAIYAQNFGTLNIVDTTITGNKAELSGGAINVDTGVLNIVNSTISNNQVGTTASDYGGGIRAFQNATITMINSTLSGNSSTGQGGGAIIQGGSSLTLINSTVTGNLAGTVGTTTNLGGGIVNQDGTLTVINSVISGNASGTGNALNDVSGNVDNANHSFFGTTVSITSNTSSINGGGDALLGTLRDNGGTVQTHAPTAGSPLINGGSNAAVPTDTFDIDRDGNFAEALPLDGRGTARILGGTVDIGAVEGAGLVVTTTADVVDANDGLLSLREAVAIANGNANADTITFSAALAGQTVLLNTGLVLTNSVTIDGDSDGDGDFDVTLSDGLSGINGSLITVNAGVTAKLQSLKIDNVNAVSTLGMIANTGTLELNYSVLSNNAVSETAFGASVGTVSNFSSLTINQTIFASNTAAAANGTNNSNAVGGAGGTAAAAVFNAGTLTVTGLSMVNGNAIGGNGGSGGSPVSPVNPAPGFNGGQGGSAASGIVNAGTLSGRGSIDFLNTVTIAAGIGGPGGAGVNGGPSGSVGANGTANFGNLTLGAGTGVMATALTGTAAGDTVSGIAGGERFYGLGGDDNIQGNNSSRLYGGTGDDTITTLGYSQVHGGLGNDIIRTTRLYNTAQGLWDGGAGIDTIDASLSDYATRLVANLLTGYSNAFGVLQNFENITGSNQITGNDNLTGNNAANTLIGLIGSDTLNGLGGADNLQGGIGTDTLDGGTGIDTMAGGADSDQYIVDNTADVVIESANGGTADRVNTSVSYTLAANQQIELFSTTNSTLTTAINLTGNNLANTILGNNGINNINGGAGIDRMTGLGGSDNYFIDNALDTVFEAANGGTADRVLTAVDYTLAADQQVELLTTINSAAVNALNLTGNNLANDIVGNNGANILNGGAGMDRLRGLLGNDLYYVDSALDVVEEGANAGTADRVLTSVDFTLGLNQQIELFSTTNSTLTTAINLTGNNLANTILGNNGVNIINGGAGIDQMTGLNGNDSYVVDHALDTVIEAAGGGTADRVNASVSYTLGLNQQIELFSTTNSAGTGAINLTGNNLANQILGNNGVNVINGGLANDFLTGGLGADIFFFNTAIAGGGNVDTIADFVHLTDDIQLAQAIFTGIGATLDATELRLGTTAATTTQRIVYDSVTGNVFFDSDGSAAGAQVQFAKVTAGTVLDINDFIMV